MKKIVKPRALKWGDKIGVIAPAGPPDMTKVVRAKQIYERLGLEVVFSRSLGKQDGYLAGSDEERLRDIEEMFYEPGIRGIFCARGGYGTPRIVDKLDYEMIARNPKVFWGYSDVTCLHVALHQQTGLVTFHGPMLASDLHIEPLPQVTYKGLKQILQPQVMRIDEESGPLETMIGGEVSGKLVGGNLTLLVSLLGTPYEIDTTGAILFLEEIDEEPYRVDRMLNQLRLAGKLHDAVAIVLGSFRHCDAKAPNASRSLAMVLDEYVLGSGKPALKHAQIGHCMPVHAVPYGATAHLDTNKKLLLVEAGVCSSR
ncbi:LD-carboxypeptidase [Bacillus sp. FSL W7-1360]